jgi:hypothetical protein
VTVYLELASTYNLKGQHKDAGKVMQEAVREFINTPEEFRLASV